MHWLFPSAPTQTGLDHVMQRLRRRRRRRNRWWAPYSLVAALFAALAAHATSVTPPSFPELVSESDLIARGTVTAVSSRWVDAAGSRVIKTFVTLAIEKQLKGAPTNSVTLEFLGGTVGTETMHVVGMPEFKVGDSEIVFVHGNGVQFCPLVRLMHGRYRVEADPSTHRRFMARDDHSALTSLQEVERPALEEGVKRAAATASEALTPEEFETQVADEVVRQQR